MTHPIDLPTDALDYALPEALIARRPATPRDAARMLVVHCGADRIEHRRVHDLPACLRPDDLLVFNATTVIPARLIGRRADSGGRVEGLYLDEPTPGVWRVMLKSNGRLRPGQRIELTDEAATASARIELVERSGAEWLVRLDEGETASVLDRVGRTPLPPYILRARGADGPGDDLDRAWYQTVYADPSARGSVAAPTAGLHFTPDLLRAIDALGVHRETVLLHVGAGTFKPVTAPTLAEHEMHHERYTVPASTIDALRRASGRRLAVGTTTVRTLESLPADLSTVAGVVSGSTDLLIAPGWSFRHVDGMLTNFHLPRSTLLALVGAMTGLDRLKAIYAAAIAEAYRFYSYGDAMLVLP
ncbi:MAG: tRNA preQ1(34) S-adenosylmethionine ribosyltransferase-isomerase QueA [Phycisphaerales bacterium]|nr:tRNA preQ1(34) S-adenosylmethionine ribosyltransferase-isomerase QueA [Phycisphaerales bacterium]